MTNGRHLLGAGRSGDQLLARLAEQQVVPPQHGQDADVSDWASQTQAGQAQAAPQQAQPGFAAAVGIGLSVPALIPLKVARTNAATIPISSRRIIFGLRFWERSRTFEEI